MHKKYLLLLLNLALLVSGSYPATASGWKEITHELSKILNGPVPGSPVYIKTGLQRDVRSANYKNVVYRRAVISLLIGTMTTRNTYMFDCDEASYKTSETGPGDWESVNWITPDSPRDLSWAMYKYLCPTAKSPWLNVSESADGKFTYFNSNTHYSFQSAHYGKVSTWITYTTLQRPQGIAPESTASTSKVRFGDTLTTLAQRYGLTLHELLRLNPGIESARLAVGTTIRTNVNSPYQRRSHLSIGDYALSEDSPFGRFYVSCQRGLSQWYGLNARDADIELEEDNPGSVGAQLSSLICKP